MAIIFKISPFEALSTTDLYDLLQLRSEVFVVEQNCVYQDIDGKDSQALHILGEYGGKIVACARIFPAGAYFANASIGRVVVKKEFRDKKWGHNLMREAIRAVKSNFGNVSITISAQLYLQRFYETHGFSIVGAPYLEDDIPHIEMLRD